MKKYILALDEGTTSTRAILFDREGKAVSVAQHEITQHYPHPGWVEQDPVEIYASQYSSMTEAVVKSGVDPSEIDSIGITNQRETTVVWDRETGKPIYNAIVWQCRRTADICAKLSTDGLGDYVKKTTGLLIDPYFSGTKIKWILDNVEGAKFLAESGRLLFGTVDTWLIWKLSGGRIHATDRTNASRTMLYNIRERKWDEKLTEILGIPQSMLPEVKSSGEIFGEINLMGTDIPVSGVAGDQQAALFGQKCFGVGDAKNTYGTGCFLLMNVGSEPVESKTGLVTTCAASEKNADVCYALEGSVFTGGSVIQWLRDELGLIRDASDSEYFARKVSDSGGVYVVPAFTGLGAPYWDAGARGTIVGLTRGSGRNHIIRACLESVAYQSNDVISAMVSDTGSDLKVLRADGGASRNGFLMQFQADITGNMVEVFSNAEATALGAAFLAGLGTGFYKSRDELPSLEVSHTFYPAIDEKERIKLIEGWKRAVSRSSAWDK